MPENHPSQYEKASQRENKGIIAGKANPEPVGDNLFHSDDMALARLDNNLLMINSLQDFFLLSISIFKKNSNNKFIE